MFFRTPQVKFSSTVLAATRFLSAIQSALQKLRIAEVLYFMRAADAERTFRVNVIHPDLGLGAAKDLCRKKC